jgi:hypothetical protein
LTTFTNIQGAAITKTPVVARHRLHDLDLFTDEALGLLLEAHPAHLIEAYSTGNDSSSEPEWRRVDVVTTPGSQLIDAVRSGRLWLNVLRVDRHHPEFRELQAQLATEWAGVVPGLIPAATSSTLLISSPTATVPYHVDAAPNVLLHVRGRKRVWVYPSDNDVFVSAERIGSLLGGRNDEFIPYDPRFDGAAWTFDLGPGDMIAFPHHGPHRVENLEGLNVSLSTEVMSHRIEQRNAVRRANHFYRERLHVPLRSTRTTGPAARLKCNSFRAVTWLGRAITGRNRRRSDQAG